MRISRPRSGSRIQSNPTDPWSQFASSLVDVFRCINNHVKFSLTIQEPLQTSPNLFAGSLWSASRSTKPTHLFFGTSISLAVICNQYFYVLLCVLKWRFPKLRSGLNQLQPNMQQEYEVVFHSKQFRKVA